MTATLPPVATPRAPQNEASPADRRAKALGLPSATALVVGSIIGTGVFTMPAVMAGAGTSSIITLGVIALGAVLLGLLFGQLTKRVPNVEGGLYAYTRHEFGDFAGYLTAWCYWITCWAGNAADLLLLLTDVTAVQVDYGLPQAHAIRCTTPQNLRGQYFPAGSMRPKVEAACRFVETTGRTAAIGALCDTQAILAGEAGTIVSPDATNH